MYLGLSNGLDIIFTEARIPGDDSQALGYCLRNKYPVKRVLVMEIQPDQGGCMFKGDRQKFESISCYVALEFIERHIEC